MATNNFISSGDIFLLLVICFCFPDHHFIKYEKKEITDRKILNVPQFCVLCELPNMLIMLWKDCKCDLITKNIDHGRVTGAEK